MPSLPRPVRLTGLITLFILVPTFYFLYPSSSARDRASLGGDGQLEAGGIDSEHWRAPIEPGVDAFEREQVRGEWDDEWEREGSSPAGSGSGSGSGGEETGGTGGEGSEVGGARWAVDTAKGRVGSKANTNTNTNGKSKGTSGGVAPLLGIDETVLSGGVIMPKLENATAKAELGRAAWKVLHLITLRFPDEPTEDDRAALKSYFHLFSRLYPCGECAAEFQKLLKEYPPQTSSRKSASLWLCHVHNLVNERLGKPEFDCLTLDATYDCGCGDEAGASGSGSALGAKKTSAREVEVEEDVVDREESGGYRPLAGMGSKAKTVVDAHDQDEDDW